MGVCVYVLAYLGMCVWVYVLVCVCEGMCMLVNASLSILYENESEKKENVFFTSRNHQHYTIAAVAATATTNTVDIVAPCRMLIVSDDLRLPLSERNWWSNICMKSFIHTGYK